MFLNIEDPIRFSRIDRAQQETTQSMHDKACHELQSIRKKIADKGWRILVVDDNPVNRKLMRILLEKNGQEVVLACDGQEAVALVKDMWFDAVLMDLQMPVMSGLEATSRIREAEEAEGTRIPVIAITAFGSPEYQKERCLEVGMDAYLTKPIIEEIFWRTLLDVMSNQQSS